MNRYQKHTLLLIVAITAIKLLVSSGIELGNDEVYYWLYALYPDISHFDHPAMVGFFIQFFTADLYFDSASWIRLAAMLPAAVNMWTTYRIGRYLKDEATGFLAVILYNISLYGLVISGIFILPDAPLLCFWLLAFFHFLKAFDKKDAAREAQKDYLIAMLFTALAIYSKYQAVYLLAGAGAYVLFYRNIWFKKGVTYLALLLPLTAVGLIFYWNAQNDFISYSFHNERVSLLSLDFNSDSFVRELAGQIIYNHPYLFALTVIALLKIKRNPNFSKARLRIFSLFSLPLMATVFYLSLYKDTLPHWTCMAYITLIPLVAVYAQGRFKHKFRTPLALLSVNLLLLGLTVGVVQKGWFLPKPQEKDKTKVGIDDFTLDLYGWEETGEQVKAFLSANPQYANLTLIANRWFPAAHIDYYVARPMGKAIHAVGKLQDIHKYHWINKARQPLSKKVLYLTDSHNYYPPKHFKSHGFINPKLVKTFEIERGGEVVKYVFLYVMEG